MKTYLLPSNYPSLYFTSLTYCQNIFRDAYLRCKQVQGHSDCCWASVVHVLSLVSRENRSCVNKARIQRAVIALEHWGSSKIRLQESAPGTRRGPAGGRAARERGTTHRTAPQCTAFASALQSCSIRCSRARARVQRAYIWNHANVMRMRCSCGLWRLVPWRWRLLQPRPVRAHPASILDRHRPP